MKQKPNTNKPTTRAADELLKKLQVQLHGQHILLSYFNILSIGPIPRHPALQSGALPTELTRLRSITECSKQNLNMVFMKKLKKERTCNSNEYTVNVQLTRANFILAISTPIGLTVSLTVHHYYVINS